MDNFVRVTALIGGWFIFFPHVFFPDVFLRSVDDYAKNNHWCDEDIDQDFFNPTDAEYDDAEIQNDEVYSYFRWPAAQIGYLKLAGRPKGQIWTHHETAGHWHKQIDYLPAGAIE